MPYIYLLCTMIFSAMLSIMGAFFNKANKSGKNLSALYNFIFTTSAFLTWLIVYLFNFEFDVKVILYSGLYGISYAVTLMGLYGALKTGLVSITSFVKQISLVGVAVWGFIFWNTPLTANIAIGMILIVFSIYFCFKPDKKEKNTVSIKWVIYALMLLGGNAGCCIIQKYQQMAFNGAYGSMLMVFACGFSAVICLITFFCGERVSLKTVQKSSWKFPVIAGMSSAFLNLFLILLASTSLSPALIYPSIAVGGIMLDILASLIIFKEKLNVGQRIGLVTGMIAIALLNM